MAEKLKITLVNPLSALFRSRERQSKHWFKEDAQDCRDAG